MIWPVVQNGFWRLRRDRSALMLSFIVPIAFFSIFAVVFGRGMKGMPKVHVIVVDQDHSAASERLVKGLQADTGLKVYMTRQPDKNAPAVNYDRTSAEAAVRAGDEPAALIIPQGWGAHPITFGPNPAATPKIQLLHDSSDPVAAQIIAGLLQRAAMTSMPASMANVGVEYLDRFAGLTREQRDKMSAQVRDLEKRQDERDAQPTTKTAQATSDNNFDGLVKVETRDIVGSKKANPTIAFYAAGIGVMFLLFSASGAGGVILDQAEAGTLDRVLSTRMTMGRFLLGQLVYLTMLGLTQLCVMFLWGALVFKVELFSHLPGFFVMAITTAATAAALGLALASACRTRAQLGAVSTLVVLTMSAIGGSMFPRFLMPEFMQKLGLITFNAWALDGFTKVFWRDEPITRLWPQVLVLATACVVFFAIARRFARRWEYS